MVEGIWNSIFEFALFSLFSEMITLGPAVASVTSMPTLSLFCSPPIVLADAIANDPSLADPKGHPKTDWILASQFDSTANTILKVFKFINVIPPVRTRIDINKNNLVVDMLYKILIALEDNQFN
jgi:hypothetical protein